MKVLLWRPAGRVSLWIVITYFLGAAVAIAATVGLFVGVLSDCLMYSAFAAALALMTPFYWTLQRKHPIPSGARLVVVLVAGTIILGVLSLHCWFSS